MRLIVDNSFEIEPGYIRLPYLGSLYWERSDHAKWNKLETVWHDRELECIWGFWRFVLTSNFRLRDDQKPSLTFA
ncbi:hypothetical protein [Terasakiella pusilla]|uniref:hypothetical protein n=1 Tax=Terasakiella pusilla TaxID=64973 RepID=UPI003AA88D94